MANNLQNLPQMVTENKFKILAKWVIQYSKFRASSALQYAPAGYKDISLIQYRTKAERYLNQGIIEAKYHNFYKALDEISKKYQPLTPSESDRKKIYNRKDKSYLKAVQPPIAKLDIVNKPICAKIKYGIQFDDTVLLFDKEDFARYFNKGIEHAGGEAGKIVTVELGEV